VVFSSDSHLRRIVGFEQCKVLCRIEIPASVEILIVFSDRMSLQEFHFPRRTKIKKVIGHRGFLIIDRIEDFVNLNRRRVRLGCSLLESKFDKSKSIWLIVQMFLIDFDGIHDLSCHSSTCQ
jgi:hypothetical protein